MSIFISSHVIKDVATNDFLLVVLGRAHCISVYFFLPAVENTAGTNENCFCTRAKSYIYSKSCQNLRFILNRISRSLVRYIYRNNKIKKLCWSKASTQTIFSYWPQTKNVESSCRIKSQHEKKTMAHTNHISKITDEERHSAKGLA